MLNVLQNLETKVVVSLNCTFFSDFNLIYGWVGRGCFTASIWGNQSGFINETAGTAQEFLLVKPRPKLFGHAEAIFKRAVSEAVKTKCNQSFTEASSTSSMLTQQAKSLKKVHFMTARCAFNHSSIFPIFGLLSAFQYQQCRLKSDGKSRASTQLVCKLIVVLNKFLWFKNKLCSITVFL